MAGFKARLLQILKKKNVIAGFLFGMTVVLSVSVKYREYSGANNVCFAESYIMSITKSFLFINMGFLIAVFDAPFIDNLSLSSVYRTGRRKWYRISWLYILKLSAAYHIILFLISLIPFITRAYPDNIWSVVITGSFYDNKGITNAGLIPPSMQFLSEFSPGFATAISFLLLNMYSVLSGGILYVFNMIFKNISAGGAIFIGVEFINFFIIRVILNFELRKFSPQVNEVPAWAYDKNVAGINFSFIYFIFLIYMVYIIGDMLIYNVDFVLKSGDKTQE